MSKNSAIIFYKDNGENHILTVIESNYGYSMLTDKKFLDEIFSKCPNGNVYALIGNTEIRIDHSDKNEKDTLERKLGTVRQVGDLLYANDSQIKNVLSGSISTEKTGSHVLVNCTIVADKFEIIPKKA